MTVSRSMLFQLECIALSAQTERPSKESLREALVEVCASLILNERIELAYGRVSSITPLVGS
jgi:hypothetical protein